METVTISEFVRKCRNVETAVTEQTEGASSKIGVCPRVVSLDKVGNKQRIPVRIFNMSAKVTKIKPKAALCELHKVKLLRHVDFAEENEQNKVEANQQSVVEDTDESPKQLPEEIHLEDSNLTREQKTQFTSFLYRSQDIFSIGITDMGNCDLVKHKINLNDDSNQRILSENPTSIVPRSQGTPETDVRCGNN